jgi:uncharacterized protein YjbI with pentapeptide repeats
MTEMLLIGGVLGTCIIVLLLATATVQVQKRGVERLNYQQQAWERAQEVHKHHWEMRQETKFADLAHKMEAHITQVKMIEQQHQHLEEVRITYELAHLPRIEDTPLPPPARQRPIPGSIDTQPRALCGAQLSGYDLSYRNLRYADLRNTDLSQANLFMADLTGACMHGANLSGSDLSATNFTDADLTGANLTNANMLVTDLNNTVLLGANLQHVRHLTAEQIAPAIIDSTTQFDNNVDRFPRMPLA